MKTIIKILLAFVMTFNSVTIYSNNENYVSCTYLCFSDIATTFYNKLIISQRIEKYTDKHIESIANKKGNIPESVISQIQSEVNYTSFINDIITILKNNYSISQMQNAINNSEQDYIEITSPKIKKEINSALIKFWNEIDTVVIQKLSSRGF